MRRRPVPAPSFAQVNSSESNTNPNSNQHTTANDRDLLLLHKNGDAVTSKKKGITANPAAVADKTDSDSGGQPEDKPDKIKVKWRIDGRRGMYAVVEAEYHFVYNGETEIECVCVATPNAAIHGWVAGALVRYGYVGSVE